MHICTCEDKRLLSGVFLCHLPPYVLRQGEPGPQQFQQASWLASPKDSSVSTAQCWNTDVSPCPAL